MQIDIEDSIFSNNDAGPVFDYGYSNNQATSIYIKGGFVNSFKRVQIVDHTGSQ